MPFWNTSYQAAAPGVDPNFGATYNSAYASNPALVAQRQALLNQLNGVASGQTPGVGNAFFNQATGQNTNNQLTMANSGRGNNPGLATRNAMTNANLFGQNAAGQGAIMNFQEKDAARNQMGNLLNSGIGMNNNLMSGQLGASMQAQGINAGIAEDNTKNNMGFASGIFNAGAGALAKLSDKNAKTNIEDGGHDITKFLDALKAHSYNYKEPDQHGEGKHISVMAQELEKSPVGKSMVEETPAGKAVDYGKGFGAILAAQAELHERMKKLESVRGKK